MGERNSQEGTVYIYTHSVMIIIIVDGTYIVEMEIAPYSVHTVVQTFTVLLSLINCTKKNAFCKLTNCICKFNNVTNVSLTGNWASGIQVHAELTEILCLSDHNTIASHCAINNVGTNKQLS